LGIIKASKWRSQRILFLCARWVDYHLVI
jgi:hypothetical protein